MAPRAQRKRFGADSDGLTVWRFKNKRWTTLPRCRSDWRQQSVIFFVVRSNSRNLFVPLDTLTWAYTNSCGWKITSA